MRFFAPSALSGDAALCDRATGRTNPLRRLVTPLRTFAFQPTGYSPHGPLTAAFRSLLAPASPGRVLFASHSLAARARRRPWGSTLRGFNPVRQASDPHGSSYPACRSFQRPPRLFYRGLAVKNFLFMQGQLPHTHSKQTVKRGRRKRDFRGSSNRTIRGATCLLS
jgi:hypothetical protein